MIVQTQMQNALVAARAQFVVNQFSQIGSGLGGNGDSDHDDCVLSGRRLETQTALPEATGLAETTKPIRLSLRASFGAKAQMDLSSRATLQDRQAGITFSRR